MNKCIYCNSEDETFEIIQVIHLNEYYNIIYFCHVCFKAFMCGPFIEKHENQKYFFFEENK